MKIRNFVKNEKSSIILIFAGLILISFSLVFFLWGDFNFSINQKINSEKFGQFGDFIGGLVGSIWALAGVILFYIALTDQRKDFQTNQNALNLQIQALNQQIQEFEAQRKELEKSRKIYEDQSKTQKVQQFESNFYSLLNVYLTIKANLNNNDANKDFFKTIYNLLKINFCPTTNIIDHQKLMVSTYGNLFNEYRGQLSHYFKLLYRILKVIDTAIGFDEKEKVFYSKILRSQLADYENLVLFYNSLTFYGNKSKPLILKYNLLKHTPLFNKPEFEYYSKVQNNNELIVFSERLNVFLTKHINESYEIDNETEKIEEKFQAFDCIAGIYFYDNIEIKIFCEKDIKKNNIELSEEQFSDFLLYFVYDRILFSTYLSPEQVTLNKFKTETESKKVFGVTIVTNAKLNLNSDKF